MNRPLAGTTALTAYIGSITAANWLAARYGQIWIAPGLVATAGTYAAGAALLTRDLVQDTLGRTAVLAGIAAGGAITWATSPALAAASTVAFTAAELADMAIYTPLRTRGWARAVLASNLVGAILDTLLFLTIAGFPLTTASIAGQLTGKLLWATLLPVTAATVVRRWRRGQVSRHPVGA